MDPYENYTPEQLARLRRPAFPQVAPEETDPGELAELRGARDRAIQELYVQSRVSGIQVPARGGLLLFSMTGNRDLATLKAVDFPGGQVCGTAFTPASALTLCRALEEGVAFDLQRCEPGRDTQLTVTPLGVVTLHAAAPQVLPDLSFAGLYEATYTFHTVRLAASLPHLLAAVRMLADGFL